MRRYLGITVTILLAIGALAGLSAVGNVEMDRPEEGELNPVRSSYNPGPTGTRAFYQLLEESGVPVARWRQPYAMLKTEARNEMLVIVGPFPQGATLPENEVSELQRWVEAGGSALIVSRHPYAQFGDPFIHSAMPSENPQWNAPTDLLIDSQSDIYIQQPTELTRGLRGLAISHLASRLTFRPPEEPEEPEEESTAKPEASPTPSPEPAEEQVKAFLYAPVIHIGDSGGAILADFKYGEGRLVMLSDPFVLANRGIGRGANLNLALNLIESLSKNEKGARRKIWFDEYHHGFQSVGNPLVAYFRGTPMALVLIQGLVLCLLVAWSSGRRFARPLPLTAVDRNSPLEFVDSMANLQRMARARELALENIYNRARAQICRKLGVSSRASTREMAARLRSLGSSGVSETELRQALSDGELILQGETADDSELLRIVAGLRRIQSRLGHRS
ncbi:MAG: DUF4350 domain-containing protein [Blastocatellales bacterium]